ncbi:MAG: Phosphoheptose isomerase [Candidatus Woesearchaeota archaeon]|nr:Phosphoheptose isomerase [Candidatus Woesearchaeota archaeon]
MEDHIKKQIMRSIETKQKVIDKLIPQISCVIQTMIDSYRSGGKLVIFGNGGSASDAQHIVGELVNKLYFNRPMLEAVALNVNPSVITAIGNDHSYEYIFARQIESLVKEKDVVIGLSTSGNSMNVLQGLLAAKEKGATTIAFTGKSGGKLKPIADILLNVPSNDVARIQESHITIGHVICELIEHSMFKEQKI